MVTQKKVVIMQRNEYKINQKILKKLIILDNFINDFILFFKFINNFFNIRDTEILLAYLNTIYNTIN